MRFGVVLGGFAGMVCRMKPVSVSDMRVVRGLFVVPVLVVVGSFAVVSRGMLVMFSSFSVMVGSFVVHGSVLFRGEMRSRRRRCRLRAVNPMGF
jgi:hypothetical protein